MKSLYPFPGLLLVVVLLFPVGNSFAQTSYHHISDKGLYRFMDELAALHIIDLATVVKPYSRQQIADFLEEANEKRDGLSPSRQAQLDYYLKEFMLERWQLKTSRGQLYQKDTSLSVHLFSPEVTYHDSLFSFLFRPVYGYRNFSGGNKDFWVTYGGAEVITSVGDNWGVYASLRDNYQPGQRLAQPSYYTQEPGGNYKGLTGGGEGGEYSEMRGGITYTWDWGSIGLVKDHVQWGDAQNGSNIFSGRTPSFPMVKLHVSPVKWLEFDYHHGWLVSQAVDSLRSFFPSNGRSRTVQRTKYIAANMFTFKPFKRFHLAIGNSIVYGDMDVQPVYLIPFAFYKSSVHSTHWGSSFQNNAMYLNISSRQIKHLHLYATYFIDEFSVRRVGDPNRHNFTSFKGGASVTGWPVDELFMGLEYTRSNPIAFLHDEPTTSFRSNRYNLGHYLEDNAEEYYGTLRWYPISTLQVGVSYVHARKGNYYEYIRGQRDPRIDELPVLDDIVWENKSLSFEAVYNPLPQLRLYASYTLSNIHGYDADGMTGQEYLDKFTAPYLHGSNNILEVGFGMGF